MALKRMLLLLAWSFLLHTQLYDHSALSSHEISEMEPNQAKISLLGLKALVSLSLFFTTASTSTSQWRDKPISLSSTGGFQIGGTTIHDGFFNKTLSCDHGYVEYFLPTTPRSTSLVMWHSSSTQVFQNRWDGGPGYKDLFLKRSYPVYLWDGPRVGRANWGCETYTYNLSYVDETNFGSWNLGPYFKKWWPGVQFPTSDEAAWKAATSARYLEFDTDKNVELHAAAMARAADSGRLGKRIVYLTNSAGGLRAMMAVTKMEESNVAAIVTYESIGYIFPDTSNITAIHGSGFGPFVVPLEDFMKLTRVPIQFVWGDNRAESWRFVKESRQAAYWINRYGGNATVLKLGEQEGMKGNTHIPFADLNNEDVAGLLDDFLGDHGLNGFEGDEDERKGNMRSVKRARTARRSIRG